MVSNQPMIDPTENVKALVAANERFREQLRATDLRHSQELRDAETRRVDQLAAQRQFYSNRMADVLRNNQQVAADSLFSQLKEVKTDLQTELRALNQFRYESTGKGQGASSLWSGAIAVISIAIAVTMAVVAINRSPTSLGVRSAEESRQNDLTLGKMAEENRRLIDRKSVV